MGIRMLAGLNRLLMRVSNKEKNAICLGFIEGVGQRIALAHASHSSGSDQGLTGSS
jgi:hypothetical protein